MGITAVPNRPEPTLWEELGSMKGGKNAPIPQAGLASYQPAQLQQQQSYTGPTGPAQAKDWDRYIQNYYQNMAGQADMQGLMNMARAFDQPQQQAQQGYQNPYVTSLMGRM